MSGNDLAEIVNVLNLYALAIDTAQWDLFDHVFTPDVRLQYPKVGATWNDLASLKKKMDEAHESIESSQHFTTNHQVVVNGDEANALSYVYVRTLPKGGGDCFEMGAWYDDVLVRTSAGWRIKSRTCRVSETTSASATYEKTTLRRAGAAGEIAYLDALRSS